ncbi:hypothetical protein BDR06DRAFT_969761 [Suillus hirtellus]|nr:hypothetical protein BDR06DRAFT_969761 [Suillus hirtellus]
MSICIVCTRELMDYEDSVSSSVTSWEGMLLLDSHIKGNVPGATGWASNPLYVDIQISEDLLTQLAEDEVPEEIILIIHHENSDNIAICESEKYVPVYDEYEDEVIPEFQNQDGVGSNVIPLKFLGITDTELNKLLLNDLMKYALINMDADEEGYAVHHSHDPVSDFAQPQKVGEESE